MTKDGNAGSSMDAGDPTRGAENSETELSRKSSSRMMKGSSNASAERPSEGGMARTTSGRDIKTKKNDAKDESADAQPVQGDTPGSPTDPADDIFDEDVVETVEEQKMSFEESDRVQKVTLQLSKPFAVYDDRKPFSFEEVYPSAKPDVAQFDYRSWMLDNNIPVVEEPQKGMEPQEMDMNAYLSRRGSAKCYNYAPTYANTAAFFPLRNPEQISVSEKVVSFQQLFQVRPETISMIFLENFRLEGHPRRQFAQQLAYFSRAEIVILRNLALNRVDDFHLAGVRYLDLSYNMLQEPQKVGMLLTRCTYLEHLSVANNPLMQVPQWRLIILAANPHLQTINSQKVSLRERISAVEKYGAKDMRQQIGFLKWDWCICAAALQLNLPKWDPLAITKLTLMSVGLSEIHVGNFRALRFLDVSKNEIATLEHSGLEYCDSLVEINLAENLLSSKEEFSVFPLVPSLQKVWLAGNKYDPQVYRRKLLYECINLRGSNRALGLQEIDGIPVTHAERVDALRKYSGLPDDRVDLLAWSYVLIAEFGHFQLRMIPNFLDCIVKLVITERSIGSADLSALRNLQVLDLSQNDMGSISGLQHCGQLRYLDLSLNPRLKLETIMNKQLKSTSALEHVLFVSDARIYEANVAGVDEYRVNVLASLMKSHRYLKSIDFIPITVSERKRAMIMRKATPAEANIYAFHCSVVDSLANSNASKKYSFHPDDVLPGKQYDPATILEIHASDLSLNSEDVDFTPFSKIQRICISQNKLSDVFSIGLRSCLDMRILDVSSNQIKCSAEDLGKFLNQFEHLEVFAVRGNPVVSKAADRARLIGSIERMQRIDCSFRVVDSIVTASERVAAWRTAGMSEDQCEDLRWQATLFQRRPQDLKPEEVLELDLSNADLRKVDLSGFRSLEVLSLRSNHLTTWKNMGFENLKRLKALDLRDNEFKTAEDLASVTKYLPSLQALGVSGNNFKSKSFREEVIRAIPALREVNCSIYLLDDDEITVDEMVSALNTGSKGLKIKGDLEKFRFEATVFRRTSRSLAPAEVTALDLSDCKISYLDLKAFTGLKKLSLRNNRVRSKHLVQAGFRSLVHLEALDIGDNLVEDMRVCAEIADFLPKLNMIFINGNPGYIQSGTKEIHRRVRFLARMSQTANVGAPLRILNGRDISPHERCEAVRSLRSPLELEELRMRLIIEEKDLIFKSSENIDISQCRLQIITPLMAFKQITVLDLSSNFLSTLQHQGLRFLPNLRVLSVEKNRLGSMEETMDELQQCHQLRILFLNKAGPFFQSPENYSQIVFERLRGLESLDDITNPMPLTKQQWLAVSYLTSRFGVGPNALHSIDLRHRNIPVKELWAIAMALADLRTELTDPADPSLTKTYGPTKLWLRDGNFTDGYVSEYRFLLVYKISTLLELDSLAISLDERANATKRMKGVLGDGKSDKLTLAAVSVSEQVVMTGVTIGTFVSAADASGSSTSGSTNEVTGVNVDYTYIAQNADNIKFFQDLKVAIAESTVAVESTGTLLSKIEIVINFFQILALILSLDVAWPSLFSVCFSWSLALNLSLDTFIPQVSVAGQYSQFFGIMFGPVVFFTIYKLNFNKDNWWSAYVTHWTRTRFKYFGLWLLGVILAAIIIVLAIPDDRSRVASGKMVTSNALIVWGYSSAGVTFILLIFLLNAWNFRRHRSDDGYWMKVYNRWRQRIGLFLLTVYYMPVSRTILLVYKCSGSSLYLFSDLSCPEFSNPGTYPWVFYVGLFFFFLYIVGVPVFFGLLIFRGVKEVETNHGFAFDDQQLKQLLADLKKDKKNKNLRQRVVQKRRAIANKYADAVVNWRSASSYLFSSYERGNKYSKIIQMMMKLALLVVTIFVGIGAFQPLVAFCIIGFFLILNSVRRPMADDLEDVMDLVAQFSNFLTAVIGYLLITNQFPSDLDADLTLVIINSANCAHMLAHFLIYPVRTCLAAREKVKATAKARESVQSLGRDVEAPDLSEAADAAETAESTELPSISVPDAQDVSASGDNSSASSGGNAASSVSSDIAAGSADIAAGSADVISGATDVASVVVEEVAEVARAADSVLDSAQEELLKESQNALENSNTDTGASNSEMAAASAIGIGGVGAAVAFQTDTGKRLKEKEKQEAAAADATPAALTAPSRPTLEPIVTEFATPSAPISPVPGMYAVDDDYEE
eukprot:ANDGO_05240.mRNA.1 Leucine-rich repeats and immunoglobulin-like domains protein sma-10